VILTRVVPGGDAALDLDTDASQLALDDYYRLPAPSWVRLNLIGSVDGSAAGSDGTSDTLTNPVDRRILRTLRGLADAVVVGAASVRAEGYYVPRSAALAVVTGSGDLSGNRIRTSGERGPLVVLCPSAAVDTVRRTLGETPALILEVPSAGGRMTPREILRILTREGYSSIVCEGGPSLAAQFLQDGVLDEICLTTSPVVGGTALPLFGGVALDETALTLTQLLVDERSFLYSRWAVARPSVRPSSPEALGAPTTH
jgi:riboflavin biosynthesis pyrimidine reductase